MPYNELPEPTSDIEQGKKNLDRFGYTIHENFFTPEETEILKTRLIEQAAAELETGVASYGMQGFSDVAHGRPWSPEQGLPTYQQISFLINKGKVFGDAVGHPTAMEYIKHVLPLMPVTVSTLSGLVVRPGAEQMITHIDQATIPFQTPMALGLNMMFALSDFTDELGATRVVPGSHLQEAPDMTLPAEEIAELKESVPASCKAGSAIIFESRLWHSQGESDKNAEGVRYSFASNYQYCFFTGQENFPASIHDDVYAQLSDEQKALLGFEVVNQMQRVAPRFEGDRSNTNETFPYIGELRR